MQNTNFNQTNTQSLFNTLNPSSFSQKQNMTQSLNSLGSTDFSAAKQKSFRSVADLEGEPELSQKNSISDWSDVPNVNSDSDPNIKLSSAYFGVNGNFDGYFEDFTTQEPIDFNKLKESSDSKYEDQSSSSSSSLSKTSKKITKLQKEDLLKHNTPKKSERNSKGKKNPWQPSEDARVLELVAHYGHSWALVAAALGNRTGKQVRDRYLNYLRSDIKDEDFTVEEDRLLLSWYYQLGHKWSKIASHIPGRTECQVKNRFYAHIKKRLTFPDFPENKANYQKNMADIFFEDEMIVNNNENENVFIYEEKKEVEFREVVNDPTDVISYENKNKNFAQMSQSIQFSAPAFPRTLSTISIPENNMVKQNDISNNFLSSFSNISSFCEETLYKPESQAGLSLENDFEISHKQALLGLESEVNNREKMQRYEELVKRKKALEFFYNKTLKEMNDLELGDLSYNKSA